MEQNTSTQPAEQPVPPPPKRNKRPQPRNVFAKHKVWFLVLLVVCVVFCMALPAKSTRPELLWADVLGRAVGMFIAANLLAGIVWVVSLITRSGTTSAQFMSVFTVALTLFMATQVFLLVHDKTSGTTPQLGTIQELTKPDLSRPNTINGALASDVVQEPVLAGGTEDPATADERTWQECESEDDTKWLLMPMDEVIESATNGHTSAQIILGQRCIGEWYNNVTNRVELGRGAVLWFQKAASQGSTRALFELANCYRSGIGVTQDESESGQLMRKAADLGYPGAQVATAVQYRFGQGVDKNPKEAFKWYVRAANQNHSGALLAVGEMYEQGEGVAQNRVKAAKCYSSAAKHDDEMVGVFSVSRRARFYKEMLRDQGFGIPGNRQEAARIYRKAAEGGDTKAEYFLGRILDYGYGLTADHNKAETWNRKAADGGYGVAQLLLGERLTASSRNNAEGRQWLLKAAGQGVGEAYKRLLSLGLDDFSVEIGSGKFRVGRFTLDHDRDAGLYAYKQRDWTNAFRFFEKSAKGGNLDAQYALSVMYSLGQGAEANQTKANEWLAKAAALPSDAALTDVGLKELQATNVEAQLAMVSQGFGAARQGLPIAAVMGNESAIQELRKRWDEGSWWGFVEHGRMQQYATNAQQVAEQLEENRISPLKGITGLRVLVSSPGKDAEDDGLRTEDLQAAVELRLRSAGIKIVRVDENVSSPFLNVNAQCFKIEKDAPTYAVHMSVSVNADAIYKFQSVNVPIWSTDRIGVCGTRRIFTVKEWVSGLVDHFANDYLKANPK